MPIPSSPLARLARGAVALALVAPSLASPTPATTTLHLHSTTHNLSTSLWLHGGSWHTVGPRTPPAELASALSPLVPLPTSFPAALIARWQTPRG